MSVASLTSLSLPPHPAFADARITISAADQTAYLETCSPELIRATIERANNYADEKTAKGETVNLGAIYKSAFANNWGLQYLEQKEHQSRIEERKSRATATRRKAPPAIEHAQDQHSEDTAPIRSRWDALSDEMQSGYLKRAINNIPRAMRTPAIKSVTVADAWEHPLVRNELSKLLDDVPENA